MSTEQLAGSSSIRAQQKKKTHYVLREVRTVGSTLTQLQWSTSPTPRHSKGKARLLHGIAYVNRRSSVWLAGQPSTNRPAIFHWHQLFNVLESSSQCPQYSVTTQFKDITGIFVNYLITLDPYTLWIELQNCDLDMIVQTMNIQ